MRIGVFGTFDVGNFGDVLFPIVTEHMFKSIDPNIEVERYSLRRKHAADWFYDVYPVQDLQARIADLDLILVGGGHIFHANHLMQQGYVPTDPSIPHPFGFWWLPLVAGHHCGIPTACHAVSVDPSFPRWSQPLLADAGKAITFPNARDHLSQDRIKNWGATNPVEVIPDSVFSINTMITRGDISAETRDYLQRHGLADKPYLIVQPSAALRKSMPFFEALIADAHKRGWGVLNLPIFSDGVKPKGYFAGIPGVITTDHWPHPTMLAEIIANADAVAGVSLHLSIVASTYGIPVFRTSYGAESKFILLDGLSNIRYMDRDAPSLEGIGRSPTPDPRIAEWQNTLTAHYTRLVEAARNGKHERPMLAADWNGLCQKPFTLRAGRGFDERLADVRLTARRYRNFLAKSLVPIMRTARSAFRA